MGSAEPPAWTRFAVWLSGVHRRLLVVGFAAVGPRAAYALSALLARGLYHLLTPLRQRSEAQCRAALGGRTGPAHVARIAEQSFVHRTWSITDLLLAERLLHAGTYRRYCRPLDEASRAALLGAQDRRQPAILLTAYYGPFDLLPVLLGLDGIRAAAVYQPHANADFEAVRWRVRRRGGWELIPLGEARVRVPEVLAGGGTVALVADHPAERRGLPVTFLGLPATASRAVGLLACQYGADVVVAGIRRRRNAFCFEIDVVDTIDHTDWEGPDDPVAYITARYLRGLERLILRDPTQYLWAYARWGEARAREFAEH